MHSAPRRAACLPALLCLLLAAAAPAWAWEPAALPPIGPLGSGDALPERCTLEPKRDRATCDLALHAISLTLENDAFPPLTTDRDYTGGMALDARFLHDIELEGAGAGEASGTALRIRSVGYYGFGLGQAIYTPHDLGAGTVVPADRPYAGWAFLGIYWGRQREGGTYSQHRIDVGTIGPQAGGHSVQRGLHDQLHESPDPKGWPFQIGHEIGVQYAYEALPRRFPLLQRDAQAAPLLDGGWFYRLRVGNIFSGGTAGLVLRLGNPADAAPDGAAQGGAALADVTSETAHLFATAALNAVLYDATIQGGLIHEHVLDEPNSPHVEEIRPVTADLSLGVAYRWRRHTLVYALTSRSSELRARRPRLFDHAYGTLHWRWRFQ
jgi:hypothetical protein